MGASNSFGTSVLQQLYDAKEYYMHSYTDIVFLTSRYKDQEQKFLIEQAITRGNIHFFIINEINDQYFLLTKADLSKFRKAPLKIKVILEPERMDPAFPSQIRAFEHGQTVGFEELLVSESQANELLELYSRADKPVSFDSRQQHITPFLTLLEETIQEFWLDFDPDAPPLKKIIIPWLIEKGISERAAGAIDLIIRPPRCKLGGIRKTKKNKDGTPK
jgi:hypothetical protein